jgi:hypothetical protein
MVLHRYASSSASHTLRVCGLAAAYAFVLVTGTAMLIAAFGAHDDGRVTAPDGERVTAAEVVMQRTAERGVQAPEALLLASRTVSNDKRGL